MNATLKAAGLKILKALWAVIVHSLDLKAADGSQVGSLNTVETVKLILNFVAANAAGWAFLGPKAAVVAGMATLILKAIQLLFTQDTKVADALAQSRPASSR